MRIGLIGKNIKVLESPNKFEINIEGIVRKETKNALLINDKLILKNNRLFVVDDKKVRGETIIGKFQERIK